MHVWALILSFLAASFVGVVAETPKRTVQSPDHSVLIWDSRYRSVSSPMGQPLIRWAPGTPDNTLSDGDRLVNRMEKEINKGKLTAWQILEVDLEGQIPEQTSTNATKKRRVTNLVAACSVLDDSLASYIGILRKDGELVVTRIGQPFYRFMYILKVLDLTPGTGKQLLFRDKDGGSAGSSGHLSLFEFADGKLRPFKDTPKFPWILEHNRASAGGRSMVSAVKLSWDGEKVIPEFFAMRAPGAWVSMGSKMPAARWGSEILGLEDAMAQIKAKPLAHAQPIVDNVLDAYLGSRMEKMMSKPAVMAMYMTLGGELDEEDSRHLEPMLDTADARRKKSDEMVSSAMIFAQSAPWPASANLGEAILIDPGNDKAWAGLGYCMMKAGHVPFSKFCYKQLRIMNSPLAKKMQASAKIKLD